MGEPGRGFGDKPYSSQSGGLCISLALGICLGGFLRGGGSAKLENTPRKIARPLRPALAPLLLLLGALAACGPVGDVATIDALDLRDRQSPGIEWMRDGRDYLVVAELQSRDGALFVADQSGQRLRLVLPQEDSFARCVEDGIGHAVVLTLRVQRDPQPTGRLTYLGSPNHRNADGCSVGEAEYLSYPG